MKNITKQRRRIVGIVFLIFLSIIGTTIVRADNDWEIALDNEEWSTSPGTYTGWSFEINKPATLKIMLATSHDIHLYVFNTTEYTKWSNLLYTEGFFLRDIYTGTYTCILSTKGTYYLILDNTDSIITSKSGTISVSVREYRGSPKIMLLLIVIGLFGFGVIGGVVTIVIIKKKRKKAVKKTDTVQEIART